MKLQVKQALTLSATLMAIKQANEMPFKLAWIFEDNIKALQDHVERAQKQQNELLVKYGEEHPKQKGSYSIAPEKVEAYKSDMNDLLDYDIEADLKPLKTEDLQDLKIKAGVNIFDLSPILDKSI